MLVFGNPACHPRPIRASQVFLLEVNIKDVGYIGWGWGLQEQWGVGRNSATKAETDREKERERERRPWQHQAGPSLKIQRGIFTL